MQVQALAALTNVPYKEVTQVDTNDYRRLRNTIDVVGNVQTQLAILIRFIREEVEEEELDVDGYSILTDTYGFLAEVIEQVEANRETLMEEASDQVEKNCNLILLEGDDG